MSKLIRAGVGLAVLVAVAGCGLRVEPTPEPAGPPAPDPEKMAMERKQASAKWQQELVMTEVGRTHPVLGATLNRNLEGLRTAIKKGPARVNEVRRDLRLGPPLREACRLRWKDGITELLDHGAGCLGDSQCESCVRASGASVGAGSPPGGILGTGSTGAGRTTAPASVPGDSIYRPRQSSPVPLRPVP